jgi:2-hydroxycyclohexanecarboxyl-CoA dehydrogenase
VAIVTGGGSGAGAVMARALAAAGLRVVVADIDFALAGQVAAGIRDGGGLALAHRCDVAIEDQVQTLIERTRREFGGLDVLVNNAGPVSLEPILSHWSRTVATNLLGTLLVTRHALEALRERHGIVINIAASDALGMAPAEQPVFAAAKAGVLRFSSAFAAEAAALGITVHCIAPDPAAVAKANALVALVCRLATAPRRDAQGAVPPSQWLACRGEEITSLGHAT